MAASLIDGKELAKALRGEVKERVAALDGPAPRLCSVVVGHDEATISYTNSQEKRAGKLGIEYALHMLPKEATTEEVAARLDELNADPAVTGIMLQTPLPKHLNTLELRDRIATRKDVEAVTTTSMGLLAQGRHLVAPCTAEAALRCLLHAAEGDITGMNVTVVGRSDIVGKPLGYLLLHQHATPTICHSRTRDLGERILGADAVIAAVGSAGLITGEMIRPGAIVVDVGTNSVEDAEGKRRLVGDVRFEEAAEGAAAITPVPGGVGPVTVALLMSNVVTLAERR